MRPGIETRHPGRLVVVLIAFVAAFWGPLTMLALYLFG
jgi:hypothetical protein